MNSVATCSHAFREFGFFGFERVELGKSGCDLTELGFNFSQSGNVAKPAAQTPHRQKGARAAGSSPAGCNSSTPTAARPSSIFVTNQVR